MIMAALATKPIRVLLVDDHAVVRSGLRVLIDSRPRLEVAGEAATPTEALAIAAREQPDIILLDLDMAGDNGLDLLPKLLGASKETRIIILTGVRDPEAHYRAMRLGASGLVLKEKAAEIVIKAIEKVYDGELWFDRSMMGSVIAEMARDNGTHKKSDPEAAKIATLTEREREVISLIGEGLKNKQIASRLYISETTVRHHLTSIFDKLGTSDRLELVIYAYRHGLAKSPR
jgi:two-component system, NarL family, nitrate/nitrite response regulator NarL